MKTVCSVSGACRRERRCWVVRSVLVGAAWPGLALAADEPGWSQRLVLLLSLVGVSVLLAAVAYVRIVRRSVPPPPLPAPSPPPPTPISEATGVVVALPSAATESRTVLTAGPPEGVGSTDRGLNDAPPAWVELRASHGPLAGQVFRLPTPNGALAIAVGRDAASCQLVFPNQLDEVGRLHCMLIWNPESCTLVVEDAGSGHGSHVNARRLAPHEATPLQDGDVIDLGGVASQRLSVRVHAAGDPFAMPSSALPRWRCVQCRAYAHLHFVEAGSSGPCPICATMPNETLVTRARGEALPGLATAPVPGPAADATSVSGAGVEPAVGWLMCTQGPDRGRDFRLVAGANAIGRGEQMPVRLARDAAVLREQHAVVEFDAARTAFVLRPGVNRGLVYLNGEELTSARPLNAQDRIELGSSTLLLVPLALPAASTSMDLAL